MPQCGQFLLFNGVTRRMLERRASRRWQSAVHPQLTLDLGTELAQPEQAGVRATRSSDGRRSGKEERCLDATFQDLLRACNVWHGARELKSSHHESEDGRRPPTGCGGIGLWEQCG
ncbi:hypothetical protein [Paraburkholderia caribensis]|jgi:hypothetical protein|uniref:hypothetical protein n=1 Tax=Paraburkholderia caribensis TaxID=75105 RepID=UPI001F1ABC7D|nr:hypothetical protein [Paraburkholderia caribensis]